MDCYWILNNLFEIALFNQNNFCFNIGKLIIQGGKIAIPASEGSGEIINLIKPLTKYGKIYISPSSISLSHYSSRYSQSFAANLYNELPITKFHLEHANVEKIDLNWLAIGY